MEARGRGWLTGNARGTRGTQEVLGESCLHLGNQVTLICFPCMRAQSLQSCPTLRPMDCSPPGSSVHGILQVETLEWVALPSFRGSSGPRDQTCVSSVSCIGRRVLYPSATWEAPVFLQIYLNKLLVYYYFFSICNTKEGSVTFQLSESNSIQGQSSESWKENLGTGFKPVQHSNICSSRLLLK